VESAVTTVLRSDERVPILGSARTDTGVHAVAQVIAFDVEHDEIPPRLVRSLSAVLRPDAQIRAVCDVAPDFDPRKSATVREYCYLIWNSDIPASFMRDRMLWQSQPLDLDSMAEATQYILGSHDFTSFCATESNGQGSMRRRVETIQLLRRGAVIIFRVRANAFLHNMIRIMVGTLLEVGEGKRTAASVADVVAAKDRSAAGRTAAALGLTLTGIEFPPEAGLTEIHPETNDFRTMLFESAESIGQRSSVD